MAFKFNPLTGNFDLVDNSGAVAQGEIDNLVILTGVPVNSTDLGTFTGGVIPDNSDIKEALQALEDEVEILNDQLSTGVTEFTGVSINGDPTKFDVGSVVGRIVDDVGNSIEISYAGTTGLSPAQVDGLTHILLDTSSIIVLQTTSPTPNERRNNIYLGSIFARAGTVIYTFSAPINLLNPENNLADLAISLKTFNESGNRFTANGSNLMVDKTAGVLFSLSSNYINDIDNPNRTNKSAAIGANFEYFTQVSGSSGITTNLIDPANYDVGGVITPIGGDPNQATIQRLFLFPATNDIFIQYGQNLYPNIATALQNISTEEFISNPNTNNGVITSLLVVRAGATDLSLLTDARFLVTSKFGETAIGAAGFSVSSLQQAYNNSIEPEIVTNSTLDAVSIRQGSGSDSDHVLEILNGASSITASINGAGTITASQIIDSGLTANTVPYANGSKQLTSSIVTPTELGYVSGVTSSIQTQFNTITNANNNVYYVSTTGNDANNGLSFSKAFLTLGAALTAVGNSAKQICVFPGTYAGNFTITNQNLTLSSANSENGGVVNFTGILTVSNAAGSVRMFGLTVDTINHTLGGSLYLENCKVNTTLSSSSSGYLEVNQSDTQGPTFAGVVSITGTGNKVFVNANKIGSVILNNASAFLNITNNLNVLPIVISAGTLGITGSTIYSATPTSNAITVTGASSFLVLDDTTLITTSNNPARLSIAAASFYSFRNAFFDKTNSVISGTNVPQSAILDGIDAGTIHSDTFTASRAVVTNASKNLITSATTATEIGFVSGVTSAIQTQLNTKAFASTGDIRETSFSIANNQVVAANVTGLAFAIGVTRSFSILASVEIDATADLFEQFTMEGINKGSTFNMEVSSVGDSSGVTFSITSAGQVQYTSSNVAGFSTGFIKFRAITTTV